MSSLLSSTEFKCVKEIPCCVSLKRAIGMNVTGLPSGISNKSCAVKCPRAVAEHYATEVAARKHLLAVRSQTQRNSSLMKRTTQYAIK